MTEPDTATTRRRTAHPVLRVRDARTNFRMETLPSSPGKLLPRKTALIALGMVASAAAARLRARAMLISRLGDDETGQRIWQIRHTPGHRGRAMGPLVAGDVFHGVLTWALAKGMGSAEGIALANAATAIKSNTFGSRYGAPDRAELHHVLEAAAR